MKYLYLALFYSLLRYFPSPTFPLLGPVFEWMRYRCCRNIFAACGVKVNVGSGARFGNGFQIQIGQYSGIGANCVVPNDIFIGDYVMMGPNVTIYSHKHNFDRIDIPMLMQGMSKVGRVVIEDDVWIGGNVIILPGRRIRKGCIVAAGAVVTKDFPEYSIIGGNPAKLVGSRSHVDVKSNGEASIEA